MLWKVVSICKNVIPIVGEVLGVATIAANLYLTVRNGIKRNEYNTVGKNAQYNGFPRRGTDTKKNNYKHKAYKTT